MAPPAEEVELQGLVDGASRMGQQGEEGYRGRFNEYEESPYPFPPEPKGRVAQPSNLYSMLLFPTGLDRLLALFGAKAGKFPTEQAIERKRRGLGGQRWPVAAWSLAVGTYEPYRDLRRS
jgi:hypothetical protein